VDIGIVAPGIEEPLRLHSLTAENAERGRNDRDIEAPGHAASSQLCK